MILLALAFGLVGAYRGAGALADVLPWGLPVLVAEALNTGIEKVVNLCSPGWNELAKQSRDAASFACGTAIAIFLFVCARALHG